MVPQQQQQQTQQSHQEQSMSKQRQIVTKFNAGSSQVVVHQQHVQSYSQHPLQQQLVNNLLVGQQSIAGPLPNQTVSIVASDLSQQQQKQLVLPLQSQQEVEVRSPQVGQLQHQQQNQPQITNIRQQSAATFQAIPCPSSATNNSNLISGNNVIQSGNIVRNSSSNLSGNSGSSRGSNSTSNFNQIIGLNPTSNNIANSRSNVNPSHHNNIVIESVTTQHHPHQQNVHHPQGTGQRPHQQQSQQHHSMHPQNLFYQQSPPTVQHQQQQPARISSGTSSLIVTSYATTMAGSSSLKPTSAITTTSTISNLQLSKSPPWRKNINTLQNQGSNQFQIGPERVPPLPHQHMVSQPPPWQEENQKRMIKIRNSPGMATTKKRPNFKDDPTGYLDHQTAILHSSILSVPSPDLTESSASRQRQPESRISEPESQMISKPRQSSVQQRQNPTVGQSQRVVQKSSTQTIDQIGNFTIGGQTVTHLPNGMVQVQQNCDIGQQLQAPRNSTTISKHNETFHQQPLLVQASQESPVSSSTAFTEKRPSSRNDAGLKGPVQGGAISTSNDSPASFSASPLSSASPSQSPDLQINRNPVTPSSNVVQKTYTKIVHKNNPTQGKLTVKPMQQKIVMENQMKVNDMSNQSPIIITQQSSTAETHQSSNVTVNVQSHHHHHQPQQQIFVTDGNGQQRLQPLVQNCIPMGTNISSLPGSQFVMTTSGQIIVVPPKTTLTNANANGLITTASNQNILISNNGHHHHHHPNAGNVIIQNSPHHHHHQGQIINTINGNIISGNLDLTDQNGRNVVIPTAQNGTTIQIANPSGNSVIINQQPQNTAKIIGQATNLLGSGHHHHHQNQILATNNHGTVTVLNTMPSGFVLQPTGTNSLIQQHHTSAQIGQPATATIDGQHVIGQLIDTGNGTQQFIQTTNLQQLGGNRVVITSPDNQLKRKSKKRKSSSGSSSTQSLSPQNSPPIMNQHHHQQQPMIQITSTPQYSQSFQISPGIPQLSILPNGSGQAGATATVTKTHITQNPGQATHQQILLQNGQTILQPLNLIQQQVLVPAGLVMTPDNTLLQIQNMAPCSSTPCNLGNLGVMIRAQSPHNKGFLSPNSGQQFIVTNQTSGQISPQQLSQIYSTPMGLMMPAHQQQQGRTFMQQNTATIMQQQQPTIVTSQHQQHHNQQHQHQTQHTLDQHRLIQQHNHHLSHPLSSGSASPPDTTTHSPQSPERPESQKSGGGSDSNMVQCVSSSEPDSVTIIPTTESPIASPSSVLDYERQIGKILCILI